MMTMPFRLFKTKSVWYASRDIDSRERHPTSRGRTAVPRPPDTEPSVSPVKQGAPPSNSTSGMPFWERVARSPEWGGGPQDGERGSNIFGGVFLPEMLFMSLVLGVYLCGSVSLPETLFVSPVLSVYLCGRRYFSGIEHYLPPGSLP